MDMRCCAISLRLERGIWQGRSRKESSTRKLMAALRHPEWCLSLVLAALHALQATSPMKLLLGCSLRYLSRLPAPSSGSHACL